MFFVWCKRCVTFVLLDDRVWVTKTENMIENSIQIEGLYDLTIIGHGSLVLLKKASESKELFPLVIKHKNNTIEEIQVSISGSLGTGIRGSKDIIFSARWDHDMLDTSKKIYNIHRRKPKEVHAQIFFG